MNSTPPHGIEDTNEKDAIVKGSLQTLAKIQTILKNVIKIEL